MSNETLPGAMPETTEPGRDAQQPPQEAEKPNDVDALQRTVKALRDEGKEYKRKLRELESASEAAKLSALEAQGKYSEAAEILKRKQEEADAAKADAESQMQAFFLKQNLTEIAKNYIADDMMDAALDFYANGKFKFVDGQVVGEKTPDEFFAELAKNKQSLARAKPVSGLGIAGTSATGSAGTINRSSLGKMSNEELKKAIGVFKAGGKVV
jgi:hypothetical protein